MVRMEGDMGSTTIVLNPRACILWKALWLWARAQKQPPKKHLRATNCTEFCVVSCFIILKRGHYLCIVFISYFCQPQNVKQSVIAGIMGQRSPTSTGSLWLSAHQEVISLLPASKLSKNRRENVSQCWRHQIEAGMKAAFVFPSSQPLPGWPDTVCCASRWTTAAAHWPWG